MSEGYVNLAKYVQGEFVHSVNFFNYLLGVHVDRIETLDDAIAKTKLQIKIAHEEFIENISSIGFSIEGELDGAIDQLYTYPYLTALITMLADKFDGYVDVLSVQPEIRALAVMEACIGVIHPLQEAFIPEDIFIEGCSRVVKNNMSKFTTSKDEAETWILPEGCRLTSQEYQGQTYWYIVNQDGKVKKRVGFENVDLSDLVEKIGEATNITIEITEGEDDELSS